MKTLQSTQSRSLSVQIPDDPEFVRGIVVRALRAVDDARQQCIIAGYVLCEKKASLGHGDFMPWVAKHIPEIHHDTANAWMRAATNVAKALKFGDSIEIEATVIPLSKLLSAPIEELPEGAHEFRQAWFDFTADKTIKDCINGVMVDGDPAHRIDRAINGKMKGGYRGEDRKAFDTFIAVKLSHITSSLVLKRQMPGTATTVFSTWRKLPAAQQAAIGTAFAAELEMWPSWLVEVIADKAKQELKKSDGERASRNARGQS